MSVNIGCTPQEIKETFMSSTVGQLEEISAILSDIDSLINSKSVELFGPSGEEGCPSEAACAKPGRTGQVTDQVDVVLQQARTIRSELRNLFSDLI